MIVDTATPTVSTSNGLTFVFKLLLWRRIENSCGTSVR